VPVTKLFSRFNIGVNVRDQESISVSNEQQFDVSQLTLGGNFRYTFTFKEVFDLSLSTNLSQQRTSYEQGQADQKYFNKTYTAETNVNFLKVYRLSGNMNYMQYENQSNNSTISIPMAGLSLSRYILKANAGEIKLAVNNLLDRRQGVSQSATNLYFERQTMNSLGRYFMLSFTYAINRHLNPMGGGRRGGGQRMMIMGG
jgi:hypothetical protein